MCRDSSANSSDRSLHWTSVAAPGQKSARDGAVLELSCQRSKGSLSSQLYWSHFVCMCAGGSVCGSFHAVPETCARSRKSLWRLCKYRHACISLVSDWISYCRIIYCCVVSYLQAVQWHQCMITQLSGYRLSQQVDERLRNVSLSWVVKISCPNSESNKC